MSAVSLNRRALSVAQEQASKAQGASAGCGVHDVARPSDARRCALKGAVSPHRRAVPMETLYADKCALHTLEAGAWKRATQNWVMIQVPRPGLPPTAPAHAPSNRARLAAGVGVGR